MGNGQKDEEWERLPYSRILMKILQPPYSNNSHSHSRPSKQCGNELKDEEEEEEWAREKKSGRNTGKDDEEKQMNLHTCDCTMGFGGIPQRNYKIYKHGRITGTSEAELPIYTETD